jgi:signal transduction histidine kinase
LGRYSTFVWTPSDLIWLHYYCIVTRLGEPLYARGVSRPPSPERSPTLGLLLGLIVTLAAVVAYSAYITWQIAGLRKLQGELIDRNRKDSLQLLRIQNDLNLLAVAMRDMIDNDEPYPLTAWSAQFQRIRTDLDDAMRLEARLAPQHIVEIYDRVQRQVYVFLIATLAAILLTGFSMIRWNRQLFARMAELSERRSELAQKLIATQESTLRYISRELHDEFGQILTAMGSMLGRAGAHAPEGSSLRSDLQEVSQMAQDTLDRVRTLSQALHPVMLDEAGLESTLDWYIPTVERQTGIALSYEKVGVPFDLNGSAAVQIYRVLQEALNNVARHSGAKQAWVRLRFRSATLELEVEDHGAGFSERPAKQGIGLVAMRERSELMGGRIVFSTPAGGGTLLHLSVPREKIEWPNKDHG